MGCVLIKGAVSMCGKPHFLTAPFKREI